MFGNVFPKNRAQVCDNVEKCGRSIQATDENRIRLKRIACWISKATDAHLEYVIFVAFPQQKWLCERASVLGYTCIAVLYFLVYRSAQ
jgi:hypothetical protein